MHDIGSRSLAELGCLTQAMLLNVCVSNDDLAHFGFWNPAQTAYSPAVRGRGLLHRECHHDRTTARKLVDRLDLRYLDTILLIRGMAEAELARAVDVWVERPRGSALPGLLWALCTDSRPKVHALGTRLCHEAVVTACARLVEEPDA